MQTQLSLFPFDLQTKNFKHVELCASLISKHEDVIPSKISTTGECTTLWKPNADYVENTHAPSSLQEYVDLPTIADNSDYVQTMYSEKTSD